MTRRGLIVLLVVLSAAFNAGAVRQGDRVTVRVDAASNRGPMVPVWAFFGYDEPNYTYMKDGQKLLSELAALSPVPVYVRTHNLLTTGDGTPALKWGSTNAYTEDAAGTSALRLDDRRSHLRHLRRAQDEAAASRSASCRRRSRPIRSRTGTTGSRATTTTTSTPAGPIRRRTTPSGASWSTSGRGTSSAKYGQAEVESWYWEVWNEPNIGYWQGTPEEYHKLYDYAADGVKRALPTAQGRRAARHRRRAARGRSSSCASFLEHCLRGTNYATGKTGSPLDFIGFHAKGAPRFVEGHVRMGISNQLRDIDDGFEIVASFPELKADADHHRRIRPGRLRRLLGRGSTRRTPTATARCTRATPPSSSPAPTSWPTSTASTCAASVTWAFEFEDQPYFAGFRDLATNGIDKPVLNVFRMLGPDGRRPAGGGQQRRVTARRDPDRRRARRPGRQRARQPRRAVGRGAAVELSRRRSARDGRDHRCDRRGAARRATSPSPSTASTPITATRTKRGSGWGSRSRRRRRRSAR